MSADQEVSDGAYTITFLGFYLLIMFVVVFLFQVVWNTCLVPAVSSLSEINFPQSAGILSLRYLLTIVVSNKKPVEEVK